MPADAALVARAARVLAAGQLVALPTETVYGLGADAENPAAVARIYAAKERPSGHPLIVHLAAGCDPSYWVADLPPTARRLMEAFWPGPLTLILPRAQHIPAAVSGGQDSIGLRCPQHPVAQQLLASFARLKDHACGGVAAPSANRFGRVSPTSAQHVRDEFPALVASGELLVLDGGAARVGIESTILDLSRLARGTPGVLLRPGQIGAAQLAEVLGYLPGAPDSAAPRVSGSLRAHYAPRTPTYLFGSPLDLPRPGAGEKFAVLALEAAPRAALASSAALERAAAQPAAAGALVWLDMPSAPEAYARELYARLRALDQGGFARIYLQAPPPEPAWDGVRDRIGRAAAAYSV